MERDEVAGPHVSSPGFQLWHLTLQWQREVTAALRPLGLTHVRFVLLAAAWWLRGREAAPNQVELAAHAGTDVKMTSQVVGWLEAHGLVQRFPDRSDTRMKRVRITSAGEQLAVLAVRKVEEVDRTCFASVEDTRELNHMMAILAGGSRRPVAPSPDEPPGPAGPAGPARR